MADLGRVNEGNFGGSGGFGRLSELSLSGSVQTQNNTLHVDYHMLQNRAGHFIIPINNLRELRGKSLEELRCADYKLIRNSFSLSENDKRALQNKLTKSI